MTSNDKRKKNSFFGLDADGNEGEEEDSLLFPSFLASTTPEEEEEKGFFSSFLEKAYTRPILSSLNPVTAALEPLIGPIGGGDLIGSVKDNVEGTIALWDGIIGSVAPSENTGQDKLTKNLQETLDTDRNTILLDAPQFVIRNFLDMASSIGQGVGGLLQIPELVKTNIMKEAEGDEDTKQDLLAFQAFAATTPFAGMVEDSVGLEVIGQRMEAFGNEWQKARGIGVIVQKYGDKADTLGYGPTASAMWNNDEVDEFIYDGVRQSAGRLLATLGVFGRLKLGFTGEGAAATAMAATVDGSLALKTNIDQSFKKTQDLDYALGAGLTKSAVEAVGNMAVLPLMGLRWAKAPLVDITAKWLGSAGSGSASYIGVREALGEDITKGEIFQVVGFNFLLGAPIDIAIGHGYKALGDIKVKPTSPDMFAPSTTETFVINYGRMHALEKNLNYLEQSVESFGESIPVRERELADIRAQNMQLPHLPGDDLPNIPTEVRQKLETGVKENSGVDLEAARQLYTSNRRTVRDANALEERLAQHPINRMSNERNAPRPIDPHNLKGGRVYGSWFEPATDPAITGRVLKEDLDAYNAATELGNKEIITAAKQQYEKSAIAHSTATKSHELGAKVYSFTKKYVQMLAKIFDPNSAYILGNVLEKSTSLGGMSSYTNKAGTKVRLLQIQESKMWSVDYNAKPDMDGHFPVVFNKWKAIETITHEFMHAAVTDKFNLANQKIRAAIVNAYSAYLEGAEKSSSIRGVLEEVTGPEITEAILPGKDRAINAANYKDATATLLSFPEFLANSFAKALLYQDGLGQIPELRQFAAENKAWFEGLTKQMEKVMPSELTLGFNNILHYMSMSRTLQKEVGLVKQAENWKPGMTAIRRVAIQHPATHSALFADTLARILGSTVKNLIAMVDSDKYTRAEKVAMRDTIKELNLHTKPDQIVISHDLASRFDQHLQFQNAIDAQWAATGVITKGVKKLLGQVPEMARWEAEIQETGKVSAVFKTLYQLAWDNPKNAYLQRFVSHIRDIVKIRNQVFTKTKAVQDRVATLTFEQQESAGRYMFAKSSGHFDDLVIDLADQLQNTPEFRGKDELLARNAAKKQLLENEYNLNSDAMRVVGEVYSYFNESLGLREKAEITNARKLGKFFKQDEVDVENKVNQIAARYKRIRKVGPYLPAIRFGDHALKIVAKKDMEFEGRIVEKGETVWFEAFEKEGDRAAAWTELKKMAAKDDFDITGYKMSDNIRNLKAVSLDFLQESREAVRRVLEKRNLSPDVLAQTMREVDDIAKGYANSSSFSKRLMQRKNVLGASNDLPRIVATYGEAFGNDYARLTVRADFDRLLTNYREYIGSEFANINDAKELRHRERHDVMAKYMGDHLDYLFFPGWEGEGLKTFGFLWHLGLNAKSAMVNLTSLPIFTYSYLANSFGDSATGTALAKSMKDIIATTIQGKEVYTPMQSAVLGRLKDSGILSQSLSRDMASVAMGGTMERVLSRKMARQYRGFKQDLVHYSGYMFQYTEMFSREAAALAAVDLAEKAGITNQDQIYRLARDTVDKTLYEYGRHNRAKVLRGPTSPLFLFQQFMMNTVYFATRKNPAATRFALLTFLASGITGLPGAEDFTDLMDAAGTMYNKLTGRNGLVDVKKGMREMLQDTGINSDFALHGFGRNGLGLTHVLGGITGIDAEFDISGSLSNGRILPFNLGRIARNAAYGNGNVEGNIDEIMGPAYAPFWGITKAISGGPDAWKAAENAMPTALRNASRGLRWYVRGEETDYSDTPILGFQHDNPEHLTEMALQSLGFSPTRLREQQGLTRMQKEHDMYWTLQKESLMELARTWYTRHLRMKNSNKDEWRGVIEEVNRYNAVAPPGYKIQDLNKSIEGKLKRDILKQMGYVSGSPNDIGKDFEDLFPDAKMRKDQPDIFPLND